MNVIVLAGYDITPEQWDDFRKDATRIPPEHPDTPLAPFVLVHSRSQSDFTLTETLHTPVKTEFSNTTYSDLNKFINSTINKLSEEQLKWRIFQDFFMVLDKESGKDRKVTIILRTLELVHLREDIDPETQKVVDIFEERPVLMVYRAPYSKTWDFWTLLSVQPGLVDDEFLTTVIPDPGPH